MDAGRFLVSYPTVDYIGYGESDVATVLVCACSWSVWPSFDEGLQCARCMEEEEREVQQAKKLENVNAKDKILLEAW